MVKLRTTSNNEGSIIAEIGMTSKDIRTIQKSLLHYASKLISDAIACKDARKENDVIFQIGCMLRDYDELFGAVIALD